MSQEDSREKVLNFIGDVKKHRQGVLFASAGALLHNMGKINSKFIRYMINIDPVGEDYEYQHICGLFLEDVRNKNLRVDRKVLLNKGYLELYDRLAGFTVNIDALSEETRNVMKQEISSLPVPFNDRIYRIGDLLEYLSSNWYKKNKTTERLNFKELGIFDSTLLTHLMNCSHHGASGGEKQDICTSQQASRLFIASPFGFEIPLVDISKESECDCYDKLRNRVEEIIQKNLSEPLNPFPIIGFARELRDLLQHALGDTQRPINDVTVWDIGHSGMAFLKSAIWSIYINDKNKSLTHDDLSDCREYPRWRLWRCSFDGLDFLTGAVSIADLNVRQRKFKEYLDEVQCFFEFAFPLGTEIYRDENGSMFIFPDIELDSIEYKAAAELYNRSLVEARGYGIGEHYLDTAIQEIIKNSGATPSTALPMNSIYGIVPQEELAKENYYNHPECKGYGWKVEKRIDVKYIGDQVKEWIANPAAAKPVDRVWQAYFENHAGVNIPDICPYCGLRPVGSGANIVKDDKKECEKYSFMAKQRKICCPCLLKRDESSKTWWNHKRFSTIWIDEVADNNGRVALVVGEFNIEKILDRLFYPYDKETEKEIKYKPYWLDGFPKENTILKIKDKDYHYDGTYLNGPVLFKEDNRKYKKNNIDVYKLDGKEVEPTLKLSFDHLEIPPEKPDEVSIYLADDKLLEKARGMDKGDDWLVLINKKCMFMGKEWKISGQRKLTYYDPDKEIIHEFVCKHFYLEAEEGAVKYYFEPVVEPIRIKPSNSFARFRRVWETTANFWRDILPPEHNYPDIQLWKNALKNSLVIKKWDSTSLRRLKLTLQMNGDNFAFSKYQPYELVGKGFKCSLVFLKTDGQKKHEFVTIENLGYIASQLGVKEKNIADPAGLVKNILEKQSRDTKFQIEETTGYGSPNKIRGNAVLVEVSYDSESFWPFIPILAEPRVFAALVPGEKALDIVKEIKKKYEKEMAKTRWRLPLKLGLVFFPRHTPLRFALDAGWRMLRSETGEFTAKVAEVERKGNNPNNAASDCLKDLLLATSVKIKVNVEKDPPFQSRDRRIIWDVPTVMGDQRTFDVWYPWVESKNKGYIHVTDLEEEDEILFAPSTFDFLDLDHPGKRFQLYYNYSLHRPGSNSPYLMEELDYFDKIWTIVSGNKGLTSTQIYNVWSLLLVKRQEWPHGSERNKKVWQEFCRQVMLNAGWKDGLPADEELDIVVRAAADGVLFDVLELHLTILKLKTKRDFKRDL